MGAGAFESTKEAPRTLAAGVSQHVHDASEKGRPSTQKPRDRTLKALVCVLGSLNSPLNAVTTCRAATRGLDYECP